MQPLQYTKPTQVEEAVALVAEQPDAAFIAGGTALLNHLRAGTRQVSRIVDITALPLTGVEVRGNSVRIGALEQGVTGEAVIRQNFPALVEALLAGASPQIRNMATPGGNLLQGLRTPFYHETGVSDAQRFRASTDDSPEEGYRLGPIFGSGNSVFGSDLGVTLSALDALVIAQGPSGTRRIPITEFYLQPLAYGEPETTLEHGELITAIELPFTPFAARSTYLKARDRASFAYLVVSVAVALDLEGDTVRDVRIALGGVATRPWRAEAAEAGLAGRTLTEAAVREAARTATLGATPKPANAYKVELAQRLVTRALSTLGGFA